MKYVWKWQRRMEGRNKLYVRYNGTVSIYTKIFADVNTSMDEHQRELMKNDIPERLY
jgi:hypothetical protein